ncbi:MAG: hypothetical protein V4601_04095, partial [Pseudomonadota bacterium]
MPFEAVTESLLKGGIAPRHVRRYVGELSDHLTDLTERQRANGYDGEDAHLRARALLGDDHELTAAMLENRRLRSWTARAPWLLLPLPFFVLPLVLLAGFVPVFIIGDGAAHITRLTAIPPELLRALSHGGLAGLNMLALPLVTLLLGGIALRRRLNLFWVMPAALLLLWLRPHMAMAFGDAALNLPGQVMVQVTPLFLHSPTLLEHAGPVLAGQYALTLLVMALMLRAQYRLNRPL